MIPHERRPFLEALKLSKLVNSKVNAMNLNVEHFTSEHHLAIEGLQ